MTFARPIRRTVFAAATLTALLAAAACGGGGSGDDAGSGTSSAPGADLSATGDTEYWGGKDTSGNLQNLIDDFNKQSTTGKVTFHELSDKADEQRQQMIQNTEIKNPAMGILNMDVVWTAEFAANQYVEALPAEQFPTDQFLPAIVKSATYFDKLYGYPTTSDGGLLYYRKDLLDKAGLEPPTTWDEMKQACAKVKKSGGNSKLDCYAGQYQKYEGLTVNFAEAVDSSGGSIIGEDGQPTVDSPEAQKGLGFLADSFKDGTIPKGAITWQEEQGRQAFQDGELMFLRNWPYVYALAQKKDGSSKVNGKFDVAPLPGLTGPGTSSLGGHNYAIAKNAAAKGTATAFIKYMASEEVMKSNVLATSAAPTLTSLYTDADVVKKYPYMPILQKSIETAKPRPVAVKYGDVTLAIQDAAYPALQGRTPPDTALTELQGKLATATK